MDFTIYLVIQNRRGGQNILSIELIEAQEYVDDSGKWKNVANPGRLETEFLNSILGFLYVEDIDRSRALVNESALGGISVSLGTNTDGDAALITSAGFEIVYEHGIDTVYPIVSKLVFPMSTVIPLVTSSSRLS